MARGLKMSQSAYEATKLLVNFRRGVGDSKFGLVVQAMFAHVLLRLGGNVLDVKNPGHPDIRAMLGGELYNIEVEAPKGKQFPAGLIAETSMSCRLAEMVNTATSAYWTLDRQWHGYALMWRLWDKELPGTCVGRCLEATPTVICPPTAHLNSQI